MRVLLVEDDKDLADAMGDILKSIIGQNWIRNEKIWVLYRNI